MHPRVSVSGLCFPGLSATDAIEAIGSLGVTSASVTGAKARASEITHPRPGFPESRQVIR